MATCLWTPILVVGLVFSGFSSAQTVPSKPVHVNRAVHPAPPIAYGPEGTPRSIPSSIASTSAATTAAIDGTPDLKPMPDGRLALVPKRFATTPIYPPPPIDAKRNTPIPQFARAAVAGPPPPLQVSPDGTLRPVPLRAMTNMDYPPIIVPAPIGAKR